MTGVVCLYPDLPFLFPFTVAYVRVCWLTCTHLPDLVLKSWDSLICPKTHVGYFDLLRKTQPLPFLLLSSGQENFTSSKNVCLQDQELRWSKEKIITVEMRNNYQSLFWLNFMSRPHNFFPSLIFFFHARTVWSAHPTQCSRQSHAPSDSAHHGYVY